MKKSVNYQIAYNFFKSWIDDGKYIKKYKNGIHFLNKSMEHIAFINRNAIFGTVRKIENGKFWFGFADEITEKQFMLSNLTYSEERELMKSLVGEYFN